MVGVMELLAAAEELDEELMVGKREGAMEPAAKNWVEQTLDRLL